MQKSTTGNPLLNFDWDFSKIEVPELTTAMGNLSSFLSYFTPEAPMEKGPTTRLTFPVFPEGDRYGHYIAMEQLSNLTNRVLSELGISFKWNWNHISALPELDSAYISYEPDTSNLSDRTVGYQISVSNESVSDK